MKEVTTRFGPIAIPERWAECKPKQIITALVCQLNYQTASSDQDKGYWRLRMITTLTSIKKAHIRKLPDTELFTLLTSIQWSFGTKLDCQPFASFRLGGRRYYLPKPKFADTTAGEVSLGNMYYLAMSNPQAPNPEMLYWLAATFCRPRRLGWWFRTFSKDYDGDDREPFNSIRTERRAEKFKKLKTGVLIAVLQYFEYLNNEFVLRYTDVFEGDPGMKPLFQHGEGWLALLEDVAESAPFGNYEEVFAKNVHTVWLYLRHKKIKADREAEEYEEAMEDQKNSYSA